MKEVRMALLEADVNFKVVKQFVASVEEKAVGSEVLNGLNPAQMVVNIVNDELVALMGSETTEISFQPGKAITVIMMSGLQGAGRLPPRQRSPASLRTIRAGSLCLLPVMYTDLRP